MISKHVKTYKDIPIAAKAAMWFVVCSFIQKAISLVTTPIFTRLFTTAEYGQFSLFNSWTEVVTILVTFKLSESVFNKSLVADEKNKKTILSVYQVISAMLWLGCFVLYLIFHSSVDKFVQLPLLYMIVMFVDIFFQNSIRLWTAYERFDYKYKILIIVTLIVAVLNPILGIWLISICRDNVLGRILGIVVASGSVGIVLFLYNIRWFRIKIFWKYCKYALVFNLPLIPHYLSQVLLNQADRIMISRYVDETSVALYSLAYTIGMLTTMVTQSVNNAYIPWMYRKLRDKQIDEIDRINWFLLILIAGIICCLFLLAPEAVMILGGTKYIEATSVVYPVAASVYFIFLYTLFANVELFYEKRKYVALGTIISAVLNIVLNAVFINYFGYVAAAYTTLFCYVCYGIFHVFVAKKILKLEGFTNQLRILGPLLIGVLIILLSFVGQLLISYFWIRIGILIGIAIIMISKRDKLSSIYSTIRRKENESD